MIAAEDLLFALKADGVEIWVEGDNLRFRAAPKALSDERRSLLRERADDLRKLLSLVAKDTGPQLQARNESGILPLSFAQERLWFLTQLEGPSTVYNISIARRLHGPLDVAAWQRSLDALFARHEALRSVFLARDGRAEVRLLDAAAGLPLVLHDLRDAPDAAAQLVALQIEETETPFDLAHGPLIRARLIRLAEEDHVFLLTLHHIVSDGWSMGVLTRELNALYAAFREGRDTPLPPLPVQYPDYAAWQRQWLAGERLKVQADYWRQTLAAAPTLLELPTDRPRPPQQDFSGAVLPVRLDAELTASLKHLAHKHGATLFTVLLSAWAAVLARLSGQHDLVIGTPSANRGRREIESLIGFFVNTLALRVDLSGDPSVAELIDRAQRTAVAAQDHQDLPFEQVVEIVQPPRSLDRSPLFQVMFAWQNNEHTAVDLPDVQVAPHATVLRKVKFDLELLLSEGNGTVGGGVGYATALFDAATIERQYGYFVMLLRAMVADDQQRVMRVELLSLEERTLLLTDWNRTEAPYPEQLCVHELFEAQVARDPDAVALIYEEQTLSYGELNARANRLARHLVALGVQPDARVGLCVERSLEMVVGLLAVLKAGGAYVPLDPAYPPERLAFMLEDCAPNVVLTHAAARAALDTATTGLAHPPVALDLLADADRWAEERDTDLDPKTLGLTPRHLAYVIYTSGSTGTPKGVQNEHRGLVNRLIWMQQAYGLTPADAVLQKTPFSFDVSVWEFLWPLLQGARLVLARPEGHKDVGYLSALIDAQTITVLHFVPSMLSSFLEGGGDLAQPGLRHIVASGEALSGVLADKVLARTRAQLHNLYGPTEASIDVTACRAQRGYSGSVPIGRPIANTRIYLLDGHGEPVPLGAVGEIHIGGAGVARGYLNRPELTAERFLDSPFVAGDRLYKTGDLARQCADGSIVYLGRTDHQIKLRGFRIELGEIEAQLLKHPAVRAAVVLAREDEPGDQRLIAYVVGEKDGHEDGENVYEFESGLRVRGVNRHETISLYDEIFVEEDYRIEGLVIPRDGCVFDVGANIGLFSLYMKGIEPSAQIYAFEPIPSTFEILEANAKAYATGVEVRNYGLSNRNGKAVFRHYPQSSANSTLYADPEAEMDVKRAYLANRAGAEGNTFDAIFEERLRSIEQECDLKSLSSVLAEEGPERIDILKVDVENSEHEVLAGIAENDWKKIRQVILEVHDHGGRLKEIEELLSRQGFTTRVMQSESLANTNLYNVFGTRIEAKEELRPWTYERMTAGRPVVSGKALRKHLSERVPEYMVPAAFVRLERLPLTPNGKLDRKSLPAPERDAYGRRAYEAPRGEVEETLSQLFGEVLKVKCVGRHDHFFELGGHSLLAIRLLERLRQRGLSAAVRDLFTAPVLADFAATLGRHTEIVVPPNAITVDSTRLTPTMLPLIDLAQEDLDQIVAATPGGLANLQDVYALSPLQDGILFHHLLAADGDPYLLTGLRAFADRALLDRHLATFQQVVDRHDILRTAFHWQGLSTPAQVVRRRATLSVTELTLDPKDGPAAEQLRQRFDPRRHRLDLSDPPLLRFVVAFDPEHQRWLVLQLLHHLIGDHSTLEFLHNEARAMLEGRGDALPAPRPFRNLIAQARLGVPAEEHERFFRTLLADVDEPTAPFGLTDVHRDGDQVVEARRMLPQPLNERLRGQSRRLGVSLASLCHLAWGQVLARISGREAVVFGTVLFGRMQAGEGADATMGLFINTLPLRLDLDGTGTEEAVRRTHARLAELLRHEHASLALAQRCSGVPPQTPLFSALLNYRHNRPRPVAAAQDATAPPPIAWLGSEERTNYPLVLSVEDFGEALGLTAQIVQPFSPERICGYMQQALEGLAEALERAPTTPVRRIEVLPAEERALLLTDWNRTEAPYPEQLCVHELFEAQVARDPDAVALIYEEQTLSYGELNARANRLARHLVALGVQPDARVGLCVERSLEMVVGLLAVLKAGGAYVPLDPAYPPERLAFMLEDCAPNVVLTHAAARAALDTATTGLAHPPVALDLLADADRWAEERDTDLDPKTLGLTPRHLAYVIYTSGSTGTPKGVMVEHHNVVNYLSWALRVYSPRAGARVPVNTPIAFDATVTSLLIPLCSAGGVYLLPPGPEELPSLGKLLAARRDCSLVKLTPAHLDGLARLHEHQQTITEHAAAALIIGGEALAAHQIRLWRQQAPGTRLINEYGPTETTVGVVTYEVDQATPLSGSIPIGRPIANTRIYLLDEHGEPVPLGAVGEIHIGGAGVARGYLNRPELTAERFLDSPFVAGDRLYKTGDLARYRPDGNIVYLGRNDQQVKIRGFRIELGEIEARLVEHPAVREAVVLAREDQPGDKRLVAYVVYAEEAAQREPSERAADLRAHLATRLPEYMVPAAYVALDALPLTPNGKLDRKALPMPEDAAYARHAFEPPVGEVEQILARIWSELLDVETISRHDHFFQLGGDSMRAMKLTSQILKALEVEVSVGIVFKCPVLSDLAEVMRDESPEELDYARAVPLPGSIISPSTVDVTG